jgi:hypothetical protein
MRAWLALVIALGLHVTDEALTGFLDFFNPMVLSIRARRPWFPMPTFTFGPWLLGLVVLVAVLTALAPAVRRGGPWTRAASWIFALIMLLNGFGHLAGSLYFRRWLPGATSAPLLLVSSVWLMRATLRRGTE